jgi:hypothetical protein
MHTSSEAQIALRKNGKCSGKHADRLKIIKTGAGAVIDQRILS